MFHAALDLSWILTALWLSDHNPAALLIAAALYGVAIEQRHPRWRLVGVVAGVGAEVWLGSVAGTLLGIVALGAGRIRSSDAASAGRYSLMAALLAWAALAFADPTLRVVLIAVAALGLLSQRSWLEDTLGTAVLVSAAALASSLAVVGLLWIVPWDALVANTLGRAGGWVAAFLLDLVPRFRTKKPPHQKSPASRGLAGSHHPAVLHAHFGADVVAVLLVLLLLAVAVWLVRRQHPFPVAEEQSRDQVQIRIDAMTGPQSAWRFERLAPVRAVARRKIRIAKRRGSGPRPGETLRQWLSAGPGESGGGPVAQVYEDVRYGGAADTKEQAAVFRRLWEKVSQSGGPQS